MKLAISNIAWQADEEPGIARALRDADVRYVEVAPTKISTAPLDLTPADVRRYREFWSEHGISIVAMQALLFGRPDLHVFGTAENRRETTEYLGRMIEIGALLGAETLVFGSPKNRLTGSLAESEVRAIESEFFGRLGELAAAAGIRFCVEPNPADYGCDYVQTLGDVQRLLRDVPSPGLGLHVDTGQMTLSGEPAGLLERLELEIQHFHVSEPHLVAAGTGGTRHEEFAAALRRGNYGRWISIEMRAGGPRNLESVLRAVQVTRSVYSPTE